MTTAERKPARDATVLRDALRALLDHYVALVASGDAGHWDAEEESVVISARAALAAADATP